MGLIPRIRASVGKRPLFEALKVRYPEFGPAELERLETLIIASVAEAIRNGKHVTFVERLPSGDIELDAIYVEDRVREIANGMRAS